MKYPELVKTLEEYGLKDMHAKVYLSLLSLGSASILSISKKSGFARSSCEAVLASLQQKGFVAGFRKKKIKYFSAEDPASIVKLAEHKVDLLKSSLPKFVELYKSRESLPSSRFYEGITGLRVVLWEMLDEAKDIVCLGSADDAYGTLLDHLHEFIEQRVKRKIPIRILLQDSALAKKRQSLQDKFLMEIRLIPNTFNCTSMLYVWNNKIAMLALKKDVVALVIENGELATLQKAMFEMLWGGTERN